MSTSRVVHVRDNVPGAVYIGRPVPREGLAGSPLANPYKIEGGRDRQQVLDMYRGLTEIRVLEGGRWFFDALIACRDRPLSCWCRHDGVLVSREKACHGDILIALLDRYTDDELRALSGGGSFQVGDRVQLANPVTRGTRLEELVHGSITRIRINRRQCSAGVSVVWDGRQRPYVYWPSRLEKVAQ